MRPPRRKNQPIIDKKFITKVLISATIVLVNTLHIFKHSLDEIENEVTSYTTTMVSYYDIIYVTINNIF